MIMTHLTLSRFSCVSHLDWRTLFTSEVALTTSDVKILDWYFLNFAQPRFHDNLPMACRDGWCGCSWFRSDVGGIAGGGIFQSKEER